MGEVYHVYKDREAAKLLARIRCEDLKVQNKVGTWIETIMRNHEHEVKNHNRQVLALTLRGREDGGLSLQRRTFCNGKRVSCRCSVWQRNNFFKCLGCDTISLQRTFAS